MIFQLEIDDRMKIIERFGTEFYSNTCKLMEIFTLKWDIDKLQLINSFSSSLVFRGISKTHGSVVMKFGVNNFDFLSEVNALRHFSGRNFCRLIDFDIENRILLEELITPGIELAFEKQIEKRVGIFTSLHNQLYQDLSNQCEIQNNFCQDFKYKSYKDWIFRITEYMEQKNEWKEIALHMKRAKGVYLELTQEYKHETLLHGDLHYYNILESKEGYRIIDPKGVMGNPIFDIPRYVLNEFCDEIDKLKVDDTIEKVFNILNRDMNLSKEVLSRLLYIEGTMAICWDIESGADISEKYKFLNTLEKFSKYMTINSI